MPQGNLLSFETPVLSGLLTRPLHFKHGFVDSPLFSDASIAHWLETHPDHLTDVNVNEFRADGTARVKTGTRGSLSGPELLEKVRTGELWINLREVFQENVQGQALHDQAFGELSDLNSAFKPQKKYANLLISSPKTRVPFHSDSPDVVLFHIRGRKRIYIYPNTAPFLRDEDMERVAVRETTEDLPYDPNWDAQADYYDLEPGEAVAWPTNAPHRIDNMGTLNISLSCEFTTWSSRMRHGAHFTNGTLRRRFGLSPKPVAQIGTFGMAWRWALSLMLKRLEVNKSSAIRYEQEFSMSDK